MKNNRIIVDLNKCQFADFFWRNQWGHTRSTKPDKPTWLGCIFDPDALCYGSKESLLTRAHRLGKLDVWTPEVRFQLTANHSLTYTGDKAVSLYKAWCEKIFRKK